MNQMKIFQIGFNKCGTLSIYKLFNDYTNLKTIHWDYGKIAYTISQNVKDNNWLLSGYDHFDVFTDMECCIHSEDHYEFIFAYNYFKLLDEQYPHSKFILNTRNIDNWINSRLKHYAGYMMESNKKIVKLDNKIEYYKLYMKAFGCDSIENMIELWKQEWIQHHNNVREYFKNREKDLLIYDIEKDDIYKIKHFFFSCNSNISFHTDIMPHDNKSKVES